MPPSRRIVDSFKAASYRRSLNSTEGGSAHSISLPDAAEVDLLGRAPWLPVVTASGTISGEHLFKLEPASCPQLKLGSNLTA